MRRAAPVDNNSAFSSPCVQSRPPKKGPPHKGCLNRQTYKYRSPPTQATMFMTKHLLALVALAVGAAASCDVCSDELYDGKCGALSQEAEDKWDDWMVEGLEIAGCIEDVCCASNEDDCCEANVGAIVGIVIALVVVIGGSVFACCKFCQGCPLNKAGGETEMTKV